MSNHPKVMHGGEICISEIIMQCELNKHRSRKMENLISVYKISHPKRHGQEREKR